MIIQQVAPDQNRYNKQRVVNLTGQISGNLGEQDYAN